MAIDVEKELNKSSTQISSFLRSFSKNTGLSEVEVINFQIAAVLIERAELTASRAYEDGVAAGKEIEWEANRANDYLSE